MKKHYYLGLNSRKRHAWRHLVTFGSRRDYLALGEALSAKYGGTAILAKNGRTALALALKAYFQRGDGIIVNGFTCYAVIEAVKAAGCVPVYADINRETLNFDLDTLESDDLGAHTKGIIVQNTLGIPVDMGAVEEFARKHNLIIIEDLAHSAGVRYPDGREAGTVGAATILSFGKDKAIDAISGGAVIYRTPPIYKTTNRQPLGRPKLSDSLRERFYPLFAGAVRGLAHVHLGGFLMRILLGLRFVEKSADNRLDFTRRMPYFEAKIALRQLPTCRGVDRDFCLVHDREKCLAELKRAGYHFAGFWYEKPVSPERYYQKVKFPEGKCKVATEVAKQIVNIPTYYSRGELKKAREIIKKYEITEETA
ncbi:DegT/DnrJ/EryC1/StrS aminotransferase family protein [Candidatus Saccharibacteria bacterium]|nr:DegT/DnrJ/EryC1/StrS aminotransferase family protein [Candidatus Saccharibacteria bacterium]